MKTSSFCITMLAAMPKPSLENPEQEPTVLFHMHVEAPTADMAFAVAMTASVEADVDLATCAGVVIQETMTPEPSMLRVHALLREQQRRARATEYTGDLMGVLMEAMQCLHRMTKH